MSFDMDIWNGEGNYFAKNLLISPDSKNYAPLSHYLDREPQILEMMQGAIESTSKKMDPVAMRMMMPPQRMPMGFYPG